MPREEGIGKVNIAIEGREVTIEAIKAIEAIEGEGPTLSGKEKGR